MHRRLKLAAAAAALALGLAACTDEQPSAQEELADQRQDALEELIKNYPVSDPDWSNDRVNIDGWVDTWGTAENAEGKLSYVYLMDMEGELVGYYVLKGLPTAKCRMSTPPYDFVDYDGDGDSYPDAQVDAPGLSGTWGGSGECNIYFGFDAVSGSYMEWVAAGGLNQLVYDQPMPLPDGVEQPMPLGNTTLEDV